MANMLALGMMMLACIILLSSCSPAQQPSATPATTCTTEDCFIAAANDCKVAALTSDQPAGTFSYAANDCVLTKTLVSLKAEESQEMKTALEGKNMTCKFEKNKFDPRWIDSLIFGSENCDGGLKDALGNLLAFT